MFETVVMAPLLAAQLIIEMYRADPRALLHKPTDENPFFITVLNEDRRNENGDLDDSPSKGKKKKLGAKDAGTKGK